LEVLLEAASHLAKSVPESGRVSVPEGAKVEDLLKGLGINQELVMLIVLDGELADLESPLSEGMAVELIPPISGG
jgi:sulfur carrier protein ThiS